MEMRGRRDGEEEVNVDVDLHTHTHTHTHTHIHTHNAGAELSCTPSSLPCSDHWTLQSVTGPS